MSEDNTTREQEKLEMLFIWIIMCFACFIYFNKVFDKVEYWLLFSKWIDIDPSVYA